MGSFTSSDKSTPKLILIISIVIIVLYKLLLIGNNIMLFHPLKENIDNRQYFQKMEK